MDFVEHLIDDGTAPEIHVDCPGRIQRISPGIIRVGLCARFLERETVRNRIVVHLLWDWEVWQRLPDLYAAARPHIKAEVPITSAVDKLRH